MERGGKEKLKISEWELERDCCYLLFNVFPFTIEHLIQSSFVLHLLTRERRGIVGAEW